MFSYLRPNHKRTSSNPSSPAERSTFERPLHPNLALDHGHPHRYNDAADTKSSSGSLPPIVRVSSIESHIEDWRAAGIEGEPRKQHWDALRNSTRPVDTDTYNTHQRVPSFSTNERPESAGFSGGINYANSQYSRSPAGAGRDAIKSPGQQYVTAIEHQNRSTQNGRRATGVRMQTPPPSQQNNVSTFDPVQPKSSKTRLNLLNPMSLLARRRTSQAVPQLLSESLVTKKGSETYDFQIKGKFVHDFSAPRVKRNVSYDSRLPDNSNQQQFQRSPNIAVTELNVPDESSVSPWSGGNHTPVFTENFDEEQYPASGPHVRKANDLTDLTLPQPPYAKSSRKQDMSNPQIPHEELQESTHERTTGDQKLVSDIGPKVPPKEDKRISNEQRRVSIDPNSTRQMSTASSNKSRPRNVSEVSNRSNRESVPRHMKSVSSRFSFDMIGAAEQERLLEDRHRQKALEKQNDAVVDYGRDDDFGDDFDYEAMMDDDGLEERIPGVNAELDEEEDDYNDGYYEEDIPGVNTALDDDLEDTMTGNKELGDFTFQQSLITPLSPYSPNTASTPRDPNGEVIGFAMSNDSQFVASQSAGPNKPELSPLAFDSFDSGTLGIEERLDGLGLQAIDLPHGVNPPYEGESGFPKAVGLDDDDLYFDDGMIGEADEGGDAVEFDESVFDNIDTDQYGRPIRLSSLPTLYNPPMLALDPSSISNDISQFNAIEVNMTSPVIGTLPGNLAPKTSVNFHQNPLQQTQTLTQDSLAAYQSALAEAAYRAAADGKFRRESVSTLQVTVEEENVHPEVGFNSTTAQESNLEAFSPSYDLQDDFDYDDAMEDDDFIAAANAEALANDSDGFYGQEFGFYSAPAKGAEFVNGGYFGPRGVEGISRSKSGRVLSLEPNLTPITERSEYSNRNSIMGLSMNRSDIISPGLAQIAGMMREGGYDGDLSLDALMKLRRGAWGGSQASLHSSTGNASPRSAAVDEGSPWSAPLQNQQSLYAMRNTAINGASPVDEQSPDSMTGNGRRKSTGMAMEIGPPQSPAASLPASPTFNRSSSMLNMEHGPQSPTDLPSPSSFSSMSRGGSNEGQSKNYTRKHQYTGSSDSISYLKQGDPVTGERWILERRRTAESGEVQLLEREVVIGGRI